MPKEWSTKIEISWPLGQGFMFSSMDIFVKVKMHYFFKNLLLYSWALIRQMECILVRVKIIFTMLMTCIMFSTLIALALRGINATILGHFFLNKLFILWWACWYAKTIMNPSDKVRIESLLLRWLWRPMGLLLCLSLSLSVSLSLSLSQWTFLYYHSFAQCVLLLVTVSRVSNVANMNEKWQIIVWNKHQTIYKL